eukprot:TRINITY_DN19470_c1_g1_i1.p1 TRINITY_DN19470_c1_g1~~TRINITY_DN19470_c1_g1_i1.p1  ORF type:complete len:518 (+),score=54.81 TRINITY_DN19470_c1_g1_i1:75-1556(+)
MASRSRRRLTRRGAAPLSAEATGARELRALLPRVWRHFRSAAPGGRSRRRRRRIADAASADAEGDGAASADASSSGHRERSAGVSDEVVTTTVQGLQEWLGRLSGPRSKRSLCGATRADILRAATAAAQLPPLRQRLGFRFRDPSKSGSWGMENLVGFTRQPVRALRGPASCEDSLVSWSSYMASYGLRVASEGSRIEVFRAVRLDSVSCRVEKRRRGNPDGPLTTGRFTVTARSRCDEAGDKRKRIRIVRAPLDLLPAVIVRPPSGPHQWTLVYLHGMGETAFGNYSDRPHYFLDGSIALKVIAPTSPQRELSCFDKWWQQVGSSAQGSKSKPKWRLAKFSAWYDYLENSGGLREDPIDWHSLYAVRTALHGLLRHEAAQLGGRFDRIILGGKSQENACEFAISWFIVRSSRCLERHVGLHRCAGCRFDFPDALGRLHWRRRAPSELHACRTRWPTGVDAAPLFPRAAGRYHAVVVGICLRATAARGWLLFA